MKYFFSIFLIVAFAVQAQAQSISTPVVTGSAFCAGTLISCTVNASGFQAGNKFQLELSDGNGNFNQPIVLGEATDTALTSISGTLPKSALAGIGYRVRLVATQPAQTSAANAQNLTIIAAPYLQLADTLRVCGTTATLDAGPGLAGYTWNTGATTQTITVSSNGDYSVTVNNGFCTNADTIHVNFNNSGIVNNDSTLCQGGEMTLNSFGVSQRKLLYENNFETDAQGWNTNTRSGFNGSTVLGPFGNGSVSLSQNFGRTVDSVEIEFDFFPFDSWDYDEPFQFYLNGNLFSTSYFQMNRNYSSDPRFFLISSIQRRCWGGGATFYYHRAKFKLPLNSSSFNFTVTQQNGDVICDESWGFDNFKIYGTGGENLTWSTGDTTQSILVRPSSNTTIQLTTSNGITTCSDSVRISVQPLPAYPLVDTVSLCAGTTVLDAGNGYQNYLWSTGATTQTIAVNQDGVYRSTVTAGACILTDSILVSLNNAQILTPDTTLCFGQELVIKTENIGGVPTPNAYFSFNSNYNDEINNTQGSPQGNVAIGNSKSNQNGLLINAKNGGVDIPDFNSNEISVDLWYFYSGNNNDWNTVLCRDGGGYHHILIERNSKQIGFYNNNFFSSGVSLTENNWYHLTVIKNGTLSRLFLNGIEIQNSNSSFSNSQFPLSRIGNYDFNTQGALGIIDEVRIYNRQISSSEINALETSFRASIKNKSALWSTGDTTASLRVQPGTTTTYVLNSSNGLTACTDSIRVSVEKPEVALALSRPTTFCSGDSLVFLATGGTRPLQFQWIRNNNPLATGTNLENFRADSSGSYSLITLSPFGCTDTSNSTALTVVQRPGALLTATSTTVNNGTPVTLVATPTYPNNVLQYVWKRGNDTLPGYNASPNQSSIITTKAGSYVVSITNDGCTDTSNILVLTAPNGGTGSAAVVPLGPAAFHYQAALTGNGGLPLAGRAVRLKLSISDSVNGVPLFQEIQSATTDNRGMVHLSIGKGQAVVGNLDQLDWAVPTPRMLVVDLDTLGNGSFVRMGASSLLSVPYAQYARTSGDGRRSVYGIIDHQAKIVQGQGFTLSNLGNGIIMIHLDEAFKELPQFWVSASDGGAIGFYQVIDRQNIQVSCSFHTGSLIQFEVKGK